MSASFAGISAYMVFPWNEMFVAIFVVNKYNVIFPQSSYGCNYWSSNVKEIVFSIPGCRQEPNQYAVKGCLRWFHDTPIFCRHAHELFCANLWAVRLKVGWKPSWPEKENNMSIVLCYIIEDGCKEGMTLEEERHINNKIYGWTLEKMVLVEVTCLLIMSVWYCVVTLTCYNLSLSVYCNLWQ